LERELKILQYWRKTETAVYKFTTTKTCI